MPKDYHREEEVDAFYEPQPHQAALLDAIYKAWTEYFRVYVALYGLEPLQKKLARPYVFAILALGGTSAAEHHIYRTQWKNGREIDNVNANATISLFRENYEEHEAMMDHYERYHAEPDQPKQKRKPKKRSKSPSKRRQS
jgi:hypothetical protein